MTFKRLLDHLTAHTWDRVKPIKPQFRSKEAWLEHCKKTGTSPDGVKR